MHKIRLIVIVPIRDMTLIAFVESLLDFAVEYEPSESDDRRVKLDWCLPLKLLMVSFIGFAKKEF